MANAADRTKADYATLPDAVLNVAPVFPYYYCHKNGYIAVDPPVISTPAPLATEIDFVVPVDYEQTNDNIWINGWRSVLAFCLDPQIIITPTGLFCYADGWASDPTSQDGFQPLYIANRKYTMKLLTPSADVIEITVTGPDKQITIGGRNDLTGFFTANPVFYLGIPPKEILNAVTNDPGYYACEGVIIKAMRRV